VLAQLLVSAGVAISDAEVAIYVAGATKNIARSYTAIPNSYPSYTLFYPFTSHLSVAVTAALGLPNVNLF